MDEGEIKVKQCLFTVEVVKQVMISILMILN